MVWIPKLRSIYRTTTVTVLGPSAHSPNLQATRGHSTDTVSAPSTHVRPSSPPFPCSTNISFPDIEAEVHYAVRHEYAQTVIDVIARRTRLSFLNAQAALNALPRVVEIMGAELGWARKRRRQELQRATAFLGSMGLAPGAAVPRIKPHGLWERVESAFWWGARGAGLFGAGAPQRVRHSRAQFGAGEIDMLRGAFAQRAALVSPGGAQGAEAQGLRMGQRDVQALLTELPGYEGVKGKDFEYVLEEAGLGRKADMDFDEFVEVCSRFEFGLGRTVLT